MMPNTIQPGEYSMGGVLEKALFIYRNRDGNLYVRYLNWSGDRWYSNYNWLDNHWNFQNPAASLTTLFISLPLL